MHLALEVEEQLEAGVPQREAELAARRAFGSVALTKEELRDMRTGAALERWAPTHGMRRAGCSGARRSPGHGPDAGARDRRERLDLRGRVSGLLNPLPYGDSDRLIALDYGMPEPEHPRPSISHTSQLYYQFLDRARRSTAWPLYRTDERTLTGQGTPERIRVSRTTPSLASVLRVTPAQGRWFTEDEGVPGAPPVAVFSHGLWARRFGQDPSVLGRLVTLDGVPTTVVGVMPPSFAFPDPRIDVWIPMPLTRATASDAYAFTGVARLRTAPRSRTPAPS